MENWIVVDMEAGKAFFFEDWDKAKKKVARLERTYARYGDLPHVYVIEFNPDNKGPLGSEYSPTTLRVISEFD